MTATQTFRVDGAVYSLAIKSPCVAVSNANLTLSGEQTVNSIAVTEGDRVLVKDQDDATENGIYVVETGAWGRAKDFDGNRDIVDGTLVTVAKTTGMNFFYQVDATDPIVIGTSEIALLLASDPSVSWPIVQSEIDFGLTTADISDSYAPGDIRRHGGMGGGVTDDSQAFIDLFGSATAGQTISGVGLTHQIDASIAVPNAITIKSFNFEIGGNFDLLSLDTDDITVDGCGFDLTTGSTSASRAMYAKDRSRIKIINNRLTNGQYGAYMDNISDLTVGGNTCDNASLWHIWIYGGNGVLVEFNICRNGTFDGIKFAGIVTTGETRTLKNVICSHNWCELNDRDGIDFAVNEAANILVSDNVLVNNKLSGIECKTIDHDDAARAYEMRNVTIRDNVMRIGSYTDSGQSLISCQSQDGVSVNTVQRFQDVLIEGNKLYIDDTSSNEFAIRTSDVKTAIIRNNTIYSNDTASIGLIRCHFGTKTIIEDNEIQADAASANGIAISSLGQGSEATTGVVIRRNRVTTAATANCVTLDDADVDGVQVYDNEFFPDSGQYAIDITNAVNTKYTNNFRGFVSVIPTTRGFLGDYYLDENAADGYPEKWAATVTGAPATWRGMNQRGFRTNAGSPAASVTPLFAGEELFDSSNSDWYRAHGTADSNWTQLTN